MIDDKKYIISKLKETVYRYDSTANILLFGSRARGDWSEESDWDFLILSSFPENDSIKNKIRKDIVEEIELVVLESVNTLFHNKEIWQKEYAVTNIFKSIQLEGIVI